MERKLLMKLCLVTLVVCNAVWMSGCSNVMTYPVDGNNCLEWANANKRSNERIVIGRLQGFKTFHAWLSDGETCRDNNNGNKPFKCDDPRYTEWKYFRTIDISEISNKRR